MITLYKLFSLYYIPFSDMDTIIINIFEDGKIFDVKISGKLHPENVEKIKLIGEAKEFDNSMTLRVMDCIFNPDRE